MKKENLRKVVFLDRDGVINRDSPDYIKSWSEFEFLPGSLEAIRLLTLNEFAVIVITNQSVINRKMVSGKGLDDLHTLIKKAVTSNGGQIKDIFYCPHVPEDRCSCRKPNPGLIFKAKEKYRIHIATSVMVGDSAKDIECARNAGCGHAVLVKTGNGEEAEKILKGLCGTASDAVDAVKLEIPQGFKLLKFKMSEYLKNIVKLIISKI
ncbi:MAG: D-glycero-beta-D-manno-heptose 1,7-bisphosphate 7-phosphatase [Deltaproteobacteria bacterium]|nr:D-glycero-beta-D-manno-heptose 1,7-bisphosphate 7-phosphatase [Deltaproteobacteria bacterium]